MKFTKIHIKEHQQFKDFTLDLTYPVGHEKAGEPLEKVCFIGQSGTGKTTLLGQLGDCATFMAFANSSGGLEIVRHMTDTNFSLYINDDITFDTLKCRNEEYKADFFLSLKDNTSDCNLLLFLKTSIAEFIDNALSPNVENTQKLIETSEKLIEDKRHRWELFDKQYIIWQIDYKTNSEVLGYFLKDIEEYDRVIKSELTTLLQGTLSIEHFSTLQNRVKGAPPRQKIAEKLNPILEKFFLEVDTSVSDALLVLKKKNDDLKIPSLGISTGTKQVLSTALPLMQLPLDNAIVLIDEPERSLFPDVQRMLVQYYTGLAPKSQFFFATHSPIIAAAFDPAERFILTFGEDGYVKATRGTAPEGDDPNDLLVKDFGMNQLLGEKGLKMFERFVELKILIKNETSLDKKADYINEYMEIGRAYNFGLDEKLKQDEKNYQKV